jgi:hypothetical protein
MNPVLLALISAAAALGGVFVGGWLTSRNQKRERQIRFHREQLGEFYGPMFAIRAESLAKSELRSKISGEADSVWRELIDDAMQGGGVEGIERARRVSFRTFEAIIEYNNRQLAEEIIPSYREMLRLFVEKMYLAEVSTITHLEDLVEFVEIWNRWLAESLPGEVVERLGHSEEKLHPFYCDVASHFVRLQAEVKESARWWRFSERPEPPKVVPLR